MKQYIGTKLIKARPMNRADYNMYRGWDFPLTKTVLMRVTWSSTLMEA